MVVLYVILGLVALLLVTQQVVELRRRSVRRSVDRYHRAMGALGEMSDHVNVIDSHAVNDAKGRIVQHDEHPVFRQAVPEIRAYVRPAVITFPTASNAVAPNEGPTTLELVEEHASQAEGTPSRWRGRGRSYAIVLAVAVAVVVAGTLVGVLLTSSTPPARHLAAKDSSKQHRRTSVVVRAPEALPKVLALTASAAEARLSTIGLRWRVIDIASPKLADAGKVIAEDPAAPATVHRGDLVTLTVARPVTTKVPNLLQPAESAQVAESALRKSGFVPKEVLVKATTPSQLALEGKVLSEDPAAGTVKPKGSAVTVKVISGAALEAIPGTLIGQSPAQAGATLASAHLTVGPATRSAFSSSVPAGNVAGTFPATPGQSVPVGSTVNLIISSGPAAIVPDLSGDTVAEARRALRQAGLSLGSVRFGIGASGVVVAQAAKPGRGLRERTPIAIVVGSTPAGNSAATVPTS